MKNYPQNRPGWKAGWTMIEFIFILIVIGILASIVMSKMSANRDDAKLSADVSNMNICIRDIGAIYTATGKDLNSIDSNACNKVICFTIEINVTSMIVDINGTGPNYCTDINSVGGHLLRTYDFAGKSIER